MIFMRINCPNAAPDVTSAVWAFEAVIGPPNWIWLT